MQALSSAQRAESLIRFLEVVKIPPKKDVETGTLQPKARLALNPSNGEINWLQSDSERSVCVTTQFDVVLRAIVGRIEEATRLLENVPNDKCREDLTRLIPEAGEALSKRIARYDQSNNRLLNCYYWRILRTDVLRMQSELGPKIEQLGKKVVTLPIFQPPPPPPPPGAKGEFRKPLPPVAKAAAAVTAEAAQPPSSPGKHTRSRSDTSQLVSPSSKFTVTVGDMDRSRLKKAAKQSDVAKP